MNNLKKKKLKTKTISPLYLTAEVIFKYKKQSWKQRAFVTICI